MPDQLRVFHYINQFYGSIGGEDRAGTGLSFERRAVGPGLLINHILGDRGSVVLTAVCGDNYFVENQETVIEELLKVMEDIKPDLVIAGPGFNAGRYGLACGAITAAVQEKLKIPCATALYAENPGTDLYKNRCYIIQTDHNAKGMGKAMTRLITFALKLADGQVINDGKTEGYHGCGPAIEIDYSIPACRRGIDMLLAKYRGEPFKTEVMMPNHEEIPIPVLDKPLSQCRVALITDGGLVPKGNPDRMVPTNSKTYRSYSIEGQRTLKAEDYEVSHQGYNNAFVLQDPNRLVPVDCMREKVEEGRIGSLHEKYYMTAGVMTSMEMGKKFGQGIAQELLDAEVSAAILTST